MLPAFGLYNHSHQILLWPRPRLAFAVIAAAFSLLWLALALDFFHIEQVLHLVHSNANEWQTMYQHIAAHVQPALMILTFFALALTLFYKRSALAIRQLIMCPRLVFIVGVMGLAAIIRVSWVLLFQAKPWADAIWYHELATNLATGKGYVWMDGTPTAFLPIGYPLFLSVIYRLFGPSILAAQIANIILSLFVVGLSYSLFLRMWNEQTARIGMLIVALSVSQISFVGILFSETLFTVVLLIALIMLMNVSLHQSHWMMAVLAGVSIGLAAMVRPLALILPLVLVAGRWWKWRTLKSLSWTLVPISIGVMIILTPNIIRNYSVFGSIVPVSTNGGMNFLIGNNPEATGYYTLPTQIHFTGNEVEQSRQAYALGLEWVRAHPVDALMGVAKKIFHLYNRDDHGVLFSVVNPIASPPWTVVTVAMIIGNVSYYLLLIAAILAVLRRRTLLGMNEYFCIFLCLGATGVYCVYFGAHRFHAPLFPIFAGFAARWIAERAGLAGSLLPRTPEYDG